MIRAARVSELTREQERVVVGDALLEINKLPPACCDLIISSPPYNIGKIYERDKRLSLDDYIEWQAGIIEVLVSKLKPSGSICWQVGNYVKNAELVPLDIPFYRIFSDQGLKLRNRIIWRFNFGHNFDRRFSGRYETILWFTKSNDYKFNLDPVRIPQIYPGKRHSQAKKNLAGSPSGNPKGKNPSDYWEFSAENDFKVNPVWDIPNVKSNHPEKTEHPCQFPIELAERCVLALTDPGDFVLDPFVGTGSSVIAAIKHGRLGYGIDKDAAFVDLARQRVAALSSGDLKMRPLGRPVRRPRASERVSQVPEEWAINNISATGGVGYGSSKCEKEEAEA